MAAIVTAVVALLVGGGVGYVIGNSSDDMSENTSTSQQSGSSDVSMMGGVDSPAADLRVGLNNALREHVDLAGVALRNVYTEAPDLEGSVAALDENSVEVAGLVGSVYGEDAQNSFLDLWRQHIGFFVNYTEGAREKDQAKMDQAKEDLAGYGEAASNFFANANPNLPKDAVMPLLEEHRDLVLETVNLMGEGDFKAAYAKLNEAADQAGSGIADNLAKGIAAQYPDKF